jgi:acetoin utilization protein AcuB
MRKEAVMIVRHWMQADPLTIPPDTLVSEAKRLLSENRLHALPVVEGKRLRGLVTRANLLRMGHFVLRTQNADEFNFFVSRLKVKDIMVRNPATVQAGDTMEHCLMLGRKLGVAQFPVLEGEALVGVISANEIFQLAAHCMGAWDRRCSVMLAPVRLGPGVLGRIAQAAESGGAVLHALYPVGRPDRAGETDKAAIVLRFDASDPARVASALAAAGFPVDEPAPSARLQLVPA